MRGIKRTLLASLLLVSGGAMGHGDVQPQAMDTSSLPKLEEGVWLEENPFAGNEEAISIGKSGYNQNCARCHGLGAVSGGIAPDLRELPSDLEGDEWFIYRIRNGAVRNGITYMPKFEGILSQEAMWSIRSWLLTIATDKE